MLGPHFPAAALNRLILLGDAVDSDSAKQSMHEETKMYAELIVFKTCLSLPLMLL